MTDTVRDDKVVLFHYSLKDSTGNEIDASGDEPLAYLHGADNIVPGLEREMTGKKAGDSFQAVVPPSEGYGDRQPTQPQPIPRDQFPAGMQLEEGMPLMAETPTGQVMTLWVKEVHDDHVLVDTNHPLAGQELHFDIEIVRVRDATEDEIDHGHPHGPDGNAGH